MLRKIAMLMAAGLSLAGCGGAAPSSGVPGAAAESASRLLTAAFTGDRATFEALIDRAAVREDLRRQVSGLAKGAALDVEGGPSDFALDRMISPAAFRLVHAGSGEALRAPPTPRQVAPLMRAVDSRHACLRDAAAPQRCVLTFAKTGGRWRLVGMKAMDLKIELADSR
jgi:hypothetical protein